jgi:[FeFe] hydrogenase (group B1/B3)
MRKFENYVQLVKYEVLKEVSKSALKGTLTKDLPKIPNIIDPGPEPRSRCCIYHERAITSERITMALGGDPSNNNIIEVLETACDQCPINRYKITEACRGCIAHRCIDSCPKDAITIVNQKAIIDYSKCIECGRCKDACPYNSISDLMRPCKRACPVNALTIDHNKKAVIDNDKCIQCGACVSMCPFGAIQDKSYVVDTIQLMSKKPTYAIIAPAFASQFSYASLGQVVAGIKALGFKDVIEVALGADLVAEHEAHEFKERLETESLMTSSCCPAFYQFVEKNYPMLKDMRSTTISPMFATAKLVKSVDPEAQIVFIGPCIAKKTEKNLYDKENLIQYVLTFEELTALLDAAEIVLEDLEEAPLNNASYYGRIFARSGGLTEGLTTLLENSEVDFKPIVCDGIDACDKALKIAAVNRQTFNFIEGMACKGGCTKGPVSLHHAPTTIKLINAYGDLALEKNPKESLRIFEKGDLNLDRL